MGLRREMAPPGWLVLAAPAVATLLIGGYQITRAPLWRDELATWSAATRSPPDLLRLGGTIDAVTVPYYLVIHLWTAVFGDSALALRLPSLLAMAAAAALTAVLGSVLAGRWAGLVAGALFAVVPSTSRYAQEARGYAFATLLAVLATLLLVRAAQRPTWRRWAAYGAAVLGLGLANLFALTLLLGHAVRFSRRWLVAAAGAVLLLVPLAAVGRGQQGDQLGWVPTPTVWDVPTLPGGVLQTPVVGGALLALAALGWAVSGRWGTVLALSVLLPAAVLFLGGLVTALWAPRYLVFAVPLLCVLASAALARVPTPAPAWVVGGAAVLALALLGAPEQVGLRKTHEWPRSAPVDYPAAARIVAAGQRPGDGVVFAPRDGWKMLDVALAHELGDRAPRDVLATRSAARRGSLWAEECPDPAACLAGAARIWLVEAGEHADPLAAVPGAKGEALRAAYTVDRAWRTDGLTVALLTARRAVA